MRSQEGARPGYIGNRSQISNRFQRALVMFDLLGNQGTYAGPGFWVRSQEGKTAAYIDNRPQINHNYQKSKSNLAISCSYVSENVSTVVPLRCLL
jgi:hypothetical protein